MLQLDQTDATTGYCGRLGYRGSHGELMETPYFGPTKHSLFHLVNHDVRIAVFHDQSSFSRPQSFLCQRTNLPDFA